jgi:RHS repeat-associated protein
MYFDKNMNVIPTQSGIIQVGEANTLGQLAQNGIVARSDGFFYTYVTNRSQGVVYFDNLSIKHWAPMVRVVYDYYPYGLTWENPKLPTDPNAVHDHAYQDKEFQFAEFTNGHGLALYDFHARMYDPCTARWLVPDPAAQFANPYLAMGNNPVVGVDPDGRFVIATIIIGAAIGAFIGGMQADRTGGNWVKGAAIGVFTGALGGVLGQIPIMSQGFGFLRGALSGSVNGLVGGGITGGVNALLTNKNVFRGIISGAAAGAVFGGVFGGIQGIGAVNNMNAALSDGSYYRKIDGARIQFEDLTTQINGSPVSQFDAAAPLGGKENCLPATAEWVDKSFGGDLSQGEIRSDWFPGTDGNTDPITLEDFEKQLDANSPYTHYKTAPSSDGLQTMYSSMNQDNERVMLILKTSQPGEAHAVGLNRVFLKTITKQNGHFASKTFYEIMNPYNTSHQFEVITQGEVLASWRWLFIQN